MLALEPSPNHHTLKERCPSQRKVCFSFAAYAKNVIDHLRLMCHVPIAEGLSEAEFTKAETKFGFTFPPDLRSILEEGLPSGVGFPDWRSGSEKELRAMLDLPISALCYEISQDNFWCTSWGQKPAQLDEALLIAIKALKRVPTLIPIYGNCYISCFPVQAGNPIFLIHEGKIYYCGYDIADFFKRQAFVPRLLQAADDAGDQSGGGDVVAQGITSNEKQSDGITPKLNTMPQMIPRGLNAVSQAAESTNVLLTLAPKTRESQPQSTDSKPNPTWRWAADSPRTPIIHSPRTPIMHVGDGESAEATTDQSTGVCITRAQSGPLMMMQKKEGGGLGQDKSNVNPDGQVFISKYLYFHEQPLPSRMLTKFTMPAPPWAARKAKRIEFWSDMAIAAARSTIHQKLPQTGQNPPQKALADQPLTPYQERGSHPLKAQPNVHDQPLTHCQEIGNRQSKAQGDPDPSPKPHHYYKPNIGRLDISQNSTAANHQQQHGSINGGGEACSASYQRWLHERGTSRWLSDYLEGLSEVLRKGRWKEEDIQEMLMEPSSAKADNMGELAMGLYSGFLRRAGWADHDTKEMFSLV